MAGARGNAAASPSSFSSRRRPRLRRRTGRAAAKAPAAGGGLRSMSISDFALMENVDVSFDSGFVAVTGASGSGKSVLLRALTLVLGGQLSSGDFCRLQQTFHRLAVR